MSNEVSNVSGDLLGIPPALFAWCKTVLQTGFAVCGEQSHGHGEGRIWKLQETDGAICWLKAHRRPHKWAQEAAFYHEFLPFAPPDFRAQTPRLLAQTGENETFRALLLSGLPGVPLETTAHLSPETERTAWQKAGRYLAAFHALPLPGAAQFGAIQRSGGVRPHPPSTSASAFITLDLQNALTPPANGTSALQPDERALGERIMAEAGAAFADDPPVLCQRDFGPRNWIVDAQTGAWIGVLDFEHTRRDVRVSDFAKLYDGPFAARPDLEAAFWQGYGPWPDTEENFAAQLRLVRITQALSQIKWARAHSDAAFEAQGHDALTRL